jgi:hypothetical protein
MRDDHGFGYKSAWLAIRSDDPRGVAEALGLDELRPASWAEGLEETYGSSGPRAPVFVAPPLDGWILTVLGGGDLFEDDGRGGGALDLSALSRRFGEAQKFASHRVVEYQEWQRWLDGSPVRRYCWIGESGEIRYDEGDPVAAEGNIIREADLDGDWEDVDFADEEVVMAVAEAWSVNPTRLDERDDLPAEGLLGYLVAR